jgi:hypothetical protein
MFSFIPAEIIIPTELMAAFKNYAKDNKSPASTAAAYTATAVQYVNGIPLPITPKAAQQQKQKPRYHSAITAGVLAVEQEKQNELEQKLKNRTVFTTTKRTVCKNCQLCGEQQPRYKEDDDKELWVEDQVKAKRDDFFEEPSLFSSSKSLNTGHLFCPSCQADRRNTPLTRAVDTFMICDRDPLVAHKYQFQSLLQRRALNGFIRAHITPTQAMIETQSPLTRELDYEKLQEEVRQQARLRHQWKVNQPIVPTVEHSMEDVKVATTTITSATVTYPPSVPLTALSLMQSASQKRSKTPPRMCATPTPKSTPQKPSSSSAAKAQFQF